jgi:ribosome recycling factor
MNVSDILKSAKDSMDKTLEFTQKNLEKVRTGRASASLVDNVKVDYYGSPTPLSQIASISVPDAKTIVIQPWDRSTLSSIEKAIQSAGLGFNPMNDGSVIRIPVPPLTEERRKEFVKMSKKIAEEGKIAVRNVRRDNMEALKKGEKDKDFSEDDKKKGEDEVQKFTDEYIRKIDDLQVKKEKELMED